MPDSREANALIGWLMIFVGGLLGSSHCVGMCGGFALALGSARGSLYANARRQAVYGLGRVFTYSTAGAAAGYGGWRLINEQAPAVRVQAILSLVAGLLLVIEGLAALGLGRGLWPARRRSGCLAPSMFAALLGATRLRSLFLGGMVNGLLPCGLVYAYLALAAAMGDMLW